MRVESSEMEWECAVSILKIPLTTTTTTTRFLTTTATIAAADCVNPGYSVS